MSSATEIRRLPPDDWQTYKQIRLTALATDPHAFGSTLERAQQLTDGDWKTRTKQAAVYIAEESGVAAGLAIGLHGEDGAELVSMWVAPDARGKGIAASLIDAVAGWAAGEGYGEIRLWVVEGNAAATKAYEKSGFVATGRRQPHRDEGPAMEMEMARATTRPPRSA